MPYKSAAYLDGGPDMLRLRAATPSRIRVHLLSTFSAGNTWSTILASSLASADLVPGDIVTGDGASGSRVTTFAEKTPTATAAASGTPPLHIAVLDHTSQVAHFVTEESTNPASVTVGRAVRINTFTDTATQPVSA